MSDSRFAVPSTLILLLLLLAPMAGAEERGNTCDPHDPPWGKTLVEPDSIVPDGGVLDTTLVVRKKKACVPTWSTNLCRGTFLRCTDPGSTAAPCSEAAPCANARTCHDAERKSCENNSDCADGVRCVKAWGWDQPELRTYGYPEEPEKPVDPANPDDPNLRWTLPGPTLNARAETLEDPSRAKSESNAAVRTGTRVKVALYNYLDPQNYNDRESCDPAGPEYEPNYPECFHGPEITNLHYHGSHVSPLPHQDYVLLELWPFDSKNVPVSDETPTPKVGKYQTDINPLPWNQPPGTHWYHPHKHGSTALQVLNGMSGAFLVAGPFDDWLDRFYADQGGLEERLLIVQQVQSELDYFNKGLQDFPPQVLINGLATPKITMRPGEIQRFRFVGATVQASAALEIGFDERIREVRQIAQDGVQFAWQNYDRQPYRDSEGTYSNFDLAPGNRADFLIQAPQETGTYVIEHNIFAEGLKEKVELLHRTEQTVAERVPGMAEQIRMKVRGESTLSAPVDPKSGDPILFTIEVEGPPKRMAFPVTRGSDPECAKADPPQRCWPETPAYLQDLLPPETPPRIVDFSMSGTAGGPTKPPDFFINKTQYKHGCAGAAMTRSTVEDWEVGNVKYDPGSNDSLLPHPFHIHVNPFQVVRDADRTFEPPYVWQDTIALPVVDLVGDADVPENERPISDKADAEKKCPAVCDGDGHATWTGEWTAETCACQDVDSRPAGPIWSNQDAQEKCPRACAADNSTWNGNWRTTIRGRLSECDCVTKSDSVLLRQGFEDYTGAFVIHCHFLGHEDRGMMWNVQTVCNPDTPWTFGTPRQDGGPDDCSRASQTALPCCPDAEGNTDCGPR